MWHRFDIGEWIAIGTAPLFSSILWSLFSGSITPLGFLFQVGIAYLGMFIIGLPMLLHLKKSGNDSRLRILVASAASGAVFGLAYVFVMFVFVNGGLSGQGLALVAAIAILFGSVIGATVGSFYIMLVYLGRRFNAT